MSIHIEPFDNRNRPIIDRGNEVTPHIYFNDVRLKEGESFEYCLEDFESGVVLGSGRCRVEAGGENFDSVGERTGIFGGKPDAVYVPKNTPVRLTCISPEAEALIAGCKTDFQGRPFRVPPGEVEKVQYGSDDTKTHRMIYHIFGKNGEGRVGNLLLSELFTVGAGGWSGFPPHRHDTDDLPRQTHHEEVYHFRFDPEQGFAAQFGYAGEEDFGPVYHVKQGSTFLLDRGYHPVVVAPGYRMYYFTILAGLSQRPLVQYFEPAHAHQLETIPGIKDMIARFR